MEKTYYTAQENTLILISLLKSHGIKFVVVSPGATNIAFVASIQQDSYFKIFSAVDERAAAYMALGLAEESGQPIVLSCTGATASRNYISGLTEAYKKHLPILAVTSTQHTGRISHYIPQVIDRSVQSKNMVKLSVQLPTLYSADDREATIVNVNNAILELTHGQSAPVHINLTTTYGIDYSVKELPKYRVIRRIERNGNFPKISNDKKVGVFVGSHAVFTKEEEIAIDVFCKKHNAIVLCEQISNYKGNYRLLANILNAQPYDFSSRRFDLIIHLGYVDGYLPFTAKEIWRVNPDGIIRDTFKKLTYVFEMSEEEFFKHYSKGADKNDSLIAQCKKERATLAASIPELPYSNAWIASKTAGKLPENSVLHLGILNTLRCWDFFETPETVSCFSNTGGFGIDGCTSSAIGAAIENSEKQFFCVVGDLSFFYDQNCLINSLPKNLHLLVVNNGVGTEFKNYNHPAAQFGEGANPYIAAKGHNGYKSQTLLKDYAENVSATYLSASNKKEYLSVLDKWLISSDKPVILEAFTTDKEESDALKIMLNLKSSFKHRVYDKIRHTKLGALLKRIIKGK